MKTIRILGVAFIIGLISTAKFAEAQHLHAHGNHYDVHQNVAHGHDAAGHMVDRFGHHVNGDGYHTGGIGVYDNGSYSYPYSSHYYGGSWSQPYYNYPSVVSSPGVIYSSPRVISSLGAISSAAQIPSSSIMTYKPVISESTTIVANKIPIPGIAGANSIPGRTRRSGFIKLINKKTTGGSISYSLNSFVYTINPGESQTLNLDRDWKLTFENGLGKHVSYRLAEGVYEFSVSPVTGWDVGKRVEAEPDRPSAPTPIQAEPVLPGNAIPVQSAPKTSGLPSVAIPTAQ